MRLYRIEYEELYRDDEEEPEGGYDGGTYYAVAHDLKHLADALKRRGFDEDEPFRGMRVHDVTLVASNDDAVRPGLFVEPGYDDLED